MIEIANKKDCCGCRACEVKCPKSCITMIEDNEGFLYPQVDQSICIDCGLCDKVCPVINQSQAIKPLEVYAAINPDENIRLNSSSGGVFTPLAKEVIDNGGIVFGVSWNKEWLAEHTFIENVEDIAKFRGSKYLQSNTNNSYAKAEEFLKTDRKVLFSGTPCQIAGLKIFLRKEYDNLLCVEVICHGVPSPKIWREYLEYMRITNKEVANNEIVNISFRDKIVGWKRFSITFFANHNNKATRIFTETLDKNIYMQGFLKDLYLRPSCHSCPARAGKSGADISIADYWGVNRQFPKLDDDKGIGLVLLYSKKGKNAYVNLKLNNTLSSYDKALKGNLVIEANVTIPKQREQFWQLYNQKGVVAIDEISRKMKVSLMKMIFRKIKQILR